MAKPRTPSRRDPFGPEFLAVALAAGAMIFAFAGRGAVAQQFDCEVIGPAAPVVCSNPELMELARETQTAFREVVRTASREERPALMRDQRDWSYSLDRCLDGAGELCLRQAYEDRISALVGQIGGRIDDRLTVAAPEPVEEHELPPPSDARTSIVGERRDSGAPGEPDAVRDEPATVDQAPDSRTPDGGDGSVRTAAVNDASESGSQVPRILTGTVWKAEIASGIRPGTIYVFNADGGLVTADCVESYRIGTWALNPDGKLILTEGNDEARTAEIVGIRERFVRLQLADSGSESGRARSLVLRPAEAPFSCRNG